MDTKKWIEEIKKEMHPVVQNLRLENVSQEAEILAQYVKILEALGTLKEFSPKPMQTGTTGEMQESKDEIRHVYVGAFQRELSGGTIGTFRIFVPESIVRNLRLEEGDWVRAKAVKSVVLKNGNLRTMYDYTLVKKTKEAKTSGRRLLSFCETRYDPYDDRLYIEKEPGETADRIYLAEPDIRNLAIGSGDLIDYAYYADAPENGRAVWKYRLSGKLVEPKAADAIHATDARLFFSDRFFVIVGEMKDGLRIQEEMEEYGAMANFLTGDERFDIMERIGTEGDTVVVILDAVTPHGLSKISDISEKHGIQILHTKDTDAFSFLRLLMEEAPFSPSAQTE